LCEWYPATDPNATKTAERYKRSTGMLHTLQSVAKKRQVIQSVRVVKAYIVIACPELLVSGCSAWQRMVCARAHPSEVSQRWYCCGGRRRLVKGAWLCAYIGSGIHDRKPQTITVSDEPSIHANARVVYMHNRRVVVCHIALLYGVHGATVMESVSVDAILEYR